MIMTHDGDDGWYVDFVYVAIFLIVRCLIWPVLALFEFSRGLPLALVVDLSSLHREPTSLFVVLFLIGDKCPI